ncbi:MAG TPA: hypothetical protein VFQ35_07005 [Polyangiaceae bacterium]|nr:hypothetical protein [Polyangiaceae bacterium]
MEGSQLKLGFPRRFVSLLFIASVPLACERAAPSSKRAQPSASAHVVDPKAYPRERLVQALAAVQARWQSLGALPDCVALLAKADERERCAAAQKQLAARQAAALAPNTTDATRLELATQVALSSQRASESLRASGVNRLLETRPKPSASGSASPPAASAARAKTVAVASAARAKTIAAASAVATKAAPTREQSDPYLDAIQAFARVTTVALAEVRAYLEFGDNALRSVALTRVETLVSEQPHWAALASLVNEAHLVESEPALKQRLGALRARLGIQ